jgi:hypothetical protein
MKSKMFKKYIALLLIYTVTTRLIGYYGLRLYFTFADNPKMLPGTVQSFQSIMTALEFFFNLVIVVLMIVDVKAKKLTDWLIILLTLFTADIGIALFIVWTFYKEWIKKYEAQQNV